MKTENQVVRFHVSTPDGVALYAWLIAPLKLFATHEKEFLDASGLPGERVETSAAFKLLKSDPESRLLIYCEYAPCPIDMLNRSLFLSSWCKLLSVTFHST